MKKDKGNIKCRLCASGKVKISFSLPNTPKNISRLLRMNELKNDRSFLFKIYCCQDCGFVQALNSPKANYYEDYPLSWTHSPQMKTYRLSQARGLIKRFNLRGKRIVDIGCGDGDYVEILNRLGVKAFGVEPSKVLRKTALSKGLRIFPGYVGPQKLIFGAPYDAFVARQVLEHVPDPNDFLRGIRLSLKDDAVGLVEIPNLHKDLKNKRFYNFFPDHLNYFSVRNLRFVLEKNGFSVLKIKTGMNGENLEAFVKVDPLLKLCDLQVAADILSKNMHVLIANARKRGKKVAVWGAGYKGNMLLSVAKVKRVEYVIDSDKNKQGLFTPVSHLLVVSPDYLRKHPVDIIIVTTMTYVDEVINQIRNNLGFKGSIVTLYQLSRPGFHGKIM